jgi:type IV secretion system protein VirB9
MNKLYIALFFAALMPFSATQAAEDVKADKRIVTERYDAGRVYDIYTAIGRVTIIQFEEDENLTVSNSSLLAMGDVEAWELGVRGRNITFKPKKKLPDTNLTIVTNKRTYLFDLKNITRGKETYAMRFFYPDTEAKLLALEAERVALAAREAQITAEAKAVKVALNTAYFWRGDNEQLKPTAAYDDGRFIHLIYDHAGALPVFYKVMPDGSEALINYHIDPDNKAIVVLHDIVKTIRARLNREVIEIVNNGYQVPKLNKFGTSQSGTVRIEKGVQHGF